MAKYLIQKAKARKGGDPGFDGIQQIRFREGPISETFGEVIAIKREFGPI